MRCRGWVILGVLCSMVAVRVSARSSDLDIAVRKARMQGIDSMFLRAVTAVPDAGFIPKAVRINVTNFVKPPDYSWSWNAASVDAVKAFMKANDTLLKTAQRKYKVSKEVISSILWIESRCGKITGTYHVPSVFLSLLMASDTANINASVNRVLSEQSLDSTGADSVRALIVRRAEKKAAWARKELIALQSIHAKAIMDVPNLKGSWAGAFGYPQFIPSSYNSWAVDGNSDGVIDLYNIEDAAKSVGNYLHVNGWGRTTKQHRKAVHHYNNSDAYVDAVFKLASKLVAPRHGSSKSKKKKR